MYVQYTFGRTCATELYITSNSLIPVFSPCILFKTCLCVYCLFKIIPRDGGLKELVSRFIRSSDLSGTTYLEENDFRMKLSSRFIRSMKSFNLYSNLSVRHPFPPPFHPTHSQRAGTPVKYHFTC